MGTPVWYFHSSLPFIRFNAYSIPSEAPKKIVSPTNTGLVSTVEDDGLGDVSIGLKQAIDLNDDKLSMAVLLQALIATGNDGFSEEDDIYSLATAVNYQYSELLKTGINMRYDVQNSDWAITAIPNIQYRLNDQWSGFSELVYRKAESQDNEYGLTSGVIYALNDRTQLDASVGVDLDGADKSYRAGLGMAFLF